jgi:hypothetical protein
MLFESVCLNEGVSMPKNDLLIPLEVPSELLQRAAMAVLRDALDNVEVHVCDTADDAIAARQLPGALKQLLFALTGYETFAMPSIDSLPELPK